MTETPAPSIRASFLRDNVKALARLGADEAAVRARIGTALDALERSVKVEWIDAAIDVQIAEAAVAVAGKARVREMNRALMRSSIEGPLLKPLHSGALALFGRRPERLFKFVPRGWQMVFKDVGTPSWDLETRTFMLEDVADPMLSEAWNEGLAGALEGLVEVFGGRAGTATLEIDRVTRCVTIPLQWLDEA